MRERKENVMMKGNKKRDEEKKSEEKLIKEKKRKKQSRREEKHVCTYFECVRDKVNEHFDFTAEVHSVYQGGRHL